MGLNEEEKKCLRLLTKWSQARKVNCQADEVMAELGVDVTTYVVLMRKMDEIGVIYNVITGMGYKYEAFSIKESRMLQSACQEYKVEIE